MNEVVTNYTIAPIIIGIIITITIITSVAISWCWGLPTSIETTGEPHLSSSYADVHYVRFHVVDHDLNPISGISITADTKMEKPDTWMITNGITNDEGYIDLVLDETIKWDITLSNGERVFYIYPYEMEYFFVSDNVYVELTSSEVM